MFVENVTIPWYMNKAMLLCIKQIIIYTANILYRQHTMSSQ